jgi:hypothetical protein
MTFNDSAVREIFDLVSDAARLTGRFDYINNHEITHAPQKGLMCSFWIQQIRPVGPASGVGVTSGVVLINGRVYKNIRSMPHDLVDTDITTAAADLMNTYSGDFDWGGDAGVRAVDLLGIYGQSLTANAGYIELDRQMFRVMTLIIPVIVNDMFVQAGLWLRLMIS